MTEYYKILKMNPYHDAQGKFTSVSGFTFGPARADRAKTLIEDLKDSNGQVAFADLKVEVETSMQLPTNTKFPDKKGSLQIDPHKLISTQENVDASGVMKYISGKGHSTEDVLVVKHPDGKLYVQDGHHRLAATIAAGARLIKAKKVTITSFDDNGKPVFKE